jgi:hypothetical protein
MQLYFFQQGVTFYNRQDFQNSEIAFRKALERDPNIGTARNYLGKHFFAAKSSQFSYPRIWRSH